MANITRRVRKRWTAIASYKASTLIPDARYDIEEIEELQELVEKGPDWNDLQKIVITYNA